MTTTLQGSQTPMYDALVQEHAFDPAASDFRSHDQFLADAGQAAWQKRMQSGRVIAKKNGRTKAMPRQRS